MRKILLPGLLVALAACSSDQPAPVNVDYRMPGPVKLDVATVTVIDHSPPVASDSPYNTNNFRPAIAEAIRKWANENLLAAGTSGEAMVLIKDASLASKFLSPEESWWTRPQAWQYNAHAQVEITVMGREGYARASAEASRYETLPQSPSVQERKNAYNTVLNGLMQDLGANMSAAIRDHLGAFLITAPGIDKPVPLAPSAAEPAPVPAAATGKPIPLTPPETNKPAPAVSVYPLP